MDGTELLELAERLEQLHATFERDERPFLNRLSDVVREFDRAWSGSYLGYQSCIYYEDFGQPPPEARYDVQWSPLGRPYGDQVGEWYQYEFEYVVKVVYSRVGTYDRTRLQERAKELTDTVNADRATLTSTLSIALRNDPGDTFLRKLLESVEQVVFPSAHEIARSMIPGGPVITSDLNAISGGRRIPPHKFVVAEAAAFSYPSQRAKELATFARQAGSHLDRVARSKSKDQLMSTNVFIGHGRSAAWKELKDFIKDRLGLPYDEFNRVPVAGYTNIERLSEMLKAAAFAFLVLTAEDEQADGQLRARMNVIHEAGLFQGRLGFARAIILLEEGCEEFSNIQGLGQIRFPKDNIEATFEQIRGVLEREGLLRTSGPRLT